MKLKTIGFDIDGTLTNDVACSCTFFFKWYKRVMKKEYNGFVKSDSKDLLERFDIPSEYRDSIYEDYMEYLIQEADLLPYTKELFDTLHRFGVKIHIVTARDEKWAEGSKAWLKKRGLHFDEFHCGVHEKDSVVKGNGIEIMVDDQPYQVEKIASVAKVFIRDNPYNKQYRGKNIWRISTYQPQEFLKMVSFAFDHEDNWATDYDYETNSKGKKGLDFMVSNDNTTIVFNPIYLAKKNITFVIPSGNPDNKSFVNALTKKMKNAHIINLYHMQLKPESLTSKEDYLLRSVIMKYRANIYKMDEKSSEAYRVKVSIIKDLLKIAKSRVNEDWIFYGIEILMLDRDNLKPFNDYPIVLTNCNETMVRKTRESKYKHDYNPWILFEDLFTDLETEIRKWKIIAGTAKKELPHYINRQFTDSDGIDRVELLDNEEPYHPQLLSSAIDEETFVIADLHLSKKDPKKTDMILDSINRTVGKDDKLLILGDLDGKRGTGGYDLCKGVIKKIKCKNLYFVVGNNDPFTIKELKKMGFDAVGDSAYFNYAHKRVILTHCPVPVSGDTVNIHGHIHGSKTYWNMDWRNHYDIWDEKYVPIKIRECLNLLEAGNLGYKSENHKPY